MDTSNEGSFSNTNRSILTQLLKRQVYIEKDIASKKNQLQAANTLLRKHFMSQIEVSKLSEELRALKNNKSLLDMELIRYRQARVYHVRAPLEGIITTVIYTQGQNITANKPVIKILPKDSDLMAELLVPIHQAGFLSKNMPVHIRYDAYPYTHFGTYKGIMHDINQSILTDEEDDKPIVMGMPYFKARVRLDTNWVRVYGARKKIQVGMTFSAVIMGTKRKIWQWMFDPVLSYRGALMT